MIEVSDDCGPDCGLLWWLYQPCVPCGQMTFHVVVCPLMVISVCQSVAAGKHYCVVLSMLLLVTAAITLDSEQSSALHLTGCKLQPAAAHLPSASFTCSHHCDIHQYRKLGSETP